MNVTKGPINLVWASYNAADVAGLKYGGVPPITKFGETAGVKDGAGREPGQGNSQR